MTLPTLEMFANDSDSDWAYALGVAGSLESPILEIVAAAEGENDGAHWICIFRLQDGRFAMMSAGCDYTGWGCQGDTGRLDYAASLTGLCGMYMDDDERHRLGLDIFGKKT